MIDLTTLPLPAVLEPLDFEAIYAAKLARFRLLYPDFSAVLESDPAIKLLELAAYDELVCRARINDAARSCFLAYAEKEDLDNKAADYNVSRLLLDPGDPDAIPPREPVWEDDERLRYRCQLALEGLSVAGSRQAYLFHTLSASASILHADIDSVQGGEVRVWLLGQSPDGAVDPLVVEQVRQALSAETVRPLCDQVQVLQARPLPFTIDARISWQEGGEQISGGLPAARQRVASMLASRRQIRASVPRSAIDAALHVPGVERVTLLQPAQDVLCGPGQFPHCQEVKLQ
ncbi:baseplate J/gp47 family protein [Aquitalea sp. ASV11]|uniref:baseplate assembly protein n=1 Tax=Aquitalea sp. ASV11 TaxID=2795103 RepID=UPI0018ED689D|nr:baseplate J/gp47 family protein [Aquitalea sp. ASV11]